jgi:hypothetical protein
VGSNAFTLNIAKGRGETTGLGGGTTRLLADTDSQPGSLLAKLMAQKTPGEPQVVLSNAAASAEFTFDDVVV